MIESIPALKGRVADGWSEKQEM